MIECTLGKHVVAGIDWTPNNSLNQESNLRHTALVQTKAITATLPAPAVGTMQILC